MSDVDSMWASETHHTCSSADATLLLKFLVTEETMLPRPAHATFSSCACLIMILTVPSASLWAKSGSVLVRVEDAQHRAVRMIEIGIDGIGGSGETGDDGKVFLAVGSETRPGDSITLRVVHSPAPNHYMLISPWDSRALVPSFEDKPDNVIRVVVVQRGERAALEDGEVLASLAAKINKANTPKSAQQSAAPVDPKGNLTAVSHDYGLAPEDVDRAIRAWGARTADPYEAGLAALYERNFPKATEELEDSLEQRELILRTDKAKVANAASFLGSSLYYQGRYADSVKAYERCLEIRPDDAWVMSNAGVSLMEAGDYTAAETQFRRTLTNLEKALGPDDPMVASALNNLASVLHAKGDYDAAETLFRSALTNLEKALGPDDPTVASALNNLASVLVDKGDYDAAETLVRRALTNLQKALGPDDPTVAGTLNSLASLRCAKGDYDAAEPAYRRALAIDEEALGPDHPVVARDLNNLGTLLKNKGQYAVAEPLFRRALAINERGLGPDHPKTASALNNLAECLSRIGDDSAAEPLYRRALAI